MEATAAPYTDHAGSPTRENSSTNFTATAASMASAARFARPMPVRHAEIVLSPASVAAETEESRSSFTSTSASSAASDGYKSDTAGRAKANSATAQGRASANVTSTANAARRRPSSAFPRAKQAATDGTEAATSP